MTALMLGLMPAVPAFAQSYPTLKIAGGDVLAGGWFGSTCNVSSNYQDASYGGGGITDQSAGGVFTYNGTSSDFAAFANGVIDKTASTFPNGFNSSAVTGGSALRLSFANQDWAPNAAGYNGGKWDGGVPNAAQCIPNYFDDKKPTGISATSIALPTSISGTQYYTGSDSGSTAATVLSGNTTINAGASVVVFITGNAYINHNIVYGGHNAANIPKFALIAKGNIYVDPSVTQLDGLYIAQPAQSNFGNAATVSSNDGTFWSCHDSDSTKTKLDSPFLNNCQQVLTVNGAVIAKRVQLTRVNASNSAREVFNYTPEMVIGGSFFPGTTSGSGSANNQPVFDRIISLPPVF